MLIRRSLRYYWRAYLAVFLGVVVTTAVLVGSLLMGDVVRYSLERIADLRLGKTQLAILSQGDNYGVGLADRLRPVLVGQTDGTAVVAPVLQLRGVVRGQQRGNQLNQVNIYGVTPDFWRLSPRMTEVPAGIVCNRHLFDNLLIGAGKDGRTARIHDEVILQVDKPSWLPRDAAMSSDLAEDTSLKLSGPIVGIVDDERFGRFGLAANQVAPMNVYVPLERISAAQGGKDLAGLVNLFLLGTTDDRPLDGAAVDAAIAGCWQPEDLGLQITPTPATGGVEIRSQRLFLDAERVVRPLADAAFPVFTYLVNDFAVAGKGARPYGMVTAVDPAYFTACGIHVPENWTDDQIIVNDWLAEHLPVKLQDAMTLTFWTMGRGRELTTVTRTFSVRAILPGLSDALGETRLAKDASLLTDSRLMPDFPGIADAKSCSDWRTSYQIDTDRFDEADNQYWYRYKGSPKAFITLAAGRQLWANRFGNATALRFPQGDAADVAALVRQRLDPTAFGLVTRDVAGQARQAVALSLDFGQLFLGMSFFLIVAALLLTALLFGLAIDSRRRELGLLKAIGMTPVQVRRRLMIEALIIAVKAAVWGTALGVGYSFVLFRLLTRGEWSAAVGGTGLVFHVTTVSLVAGLVAVVAVVLAVLWFTLRRLSSEPAAQLLRGGQATDAVHDRVRWWVRLLVPITLVGGIALALSAKADPSGAPLFFGAGACLLIAGLGACAWLLKGIGSSRHHRRRGFVGLALANASRRPGRSLTVVGVLAAASFLIVSVGAFHKDADFRVTARDGGTGGFVFWGTTTLPIYRDLNSPDGQAHHRLLDLPAGTIFIPMRTSAGDDATCLNLNRAQRPRLWGLDAGRLADLGAFSFAEAATGDVADTAAIWRQLAPGPDGDLRRLADGHLPAIVDQNTAMWSLKKGIGDTLDYPDDLGGNITFEIIALVKDSILQGGMLVDEGVLERHYPGGGGYTTFLVDAPGLQDRDSQAGLGTYLEDKLGGEGLSLVRTRDKLDAQNAMQNVYLSIFQVLGGLGLLLGSIGLGVILLRNVVERQRELSIMRSIGFGKRRLAGLLMLEHVLLLILGLGIGLATGALTVLPMVVGGPLSVGSIAVMMTIVLATGLVTIALTGAWAMRRNLVAGLRSE